MRSADLLALTHDPDPAREIHRLPLRRTIAKQPQRDVVCECELSYLLAQYNPRMSLHTLCHVLFSEQTSPKKRKRRCDEQISAPLTPAGNNSKDSSTVVTKPLLAKTLCAEYEDANGCVVTVYDGSDRNKFINGLQQPAAQRQWKVVPLVRKSVLSSQAGKLYCDQHYTNNCGRLECTPEKMQ
jgi:hypothetical protein